MSPEAENSMSEEQEFSLDEYSFSDQIYSALERSVAANLKMSPSRRRITRSERISIAEPEMHDDHAPHWRIDEVDGISSSGKCLHCGKEKTFINVLLEREEYEEVLQNRKLLEEHAIEMESQKDEALSSTSPVTESKQAIPAEEIKIRELQRKRKKGFYALELHSLGNSVAEIAQVMGISQAVATSHLQGMGYLANQIDIVRNAIKFEVMKHGIGIGSEIEALSSSEKKLLEESFKGDSFSLIAENLGISLEDTLRSWTSLCSKMGMNEREGRVYAAARYTFLVKEGYYKGDRTQKEWEIAQQAKLEKLLKRKFELD